MNNTKYYHDGDGIIREIQTETDPRLLTEYVQDKIQVFQFDNNMMGCPGYTLPGWYFWDNCTTCLIGPFETSDKANHALDVYHSGI